MVYERRRPGQPPGRLFALYVAGYAAGRLWVEALRIDPAAYLLDVRVNIWVSALVLLTTGLWLVRSRHLPSTAADPSAAVEVADAQDSEPAQTAE